MVHIWSAPLISVLLSVQSTTAFNSTKRKIKRRHGMVHFWFTSLIAVLLVVLLTVQSTTADSSSKREIVVSAVGDSLTFGLGSSKHHSTTYPAVLLQLLQQRHAAYRWVVNNFGDSGKTALRDTGKHSYWRTKTFRQSKQPNPTFVVIQLGTNDAKKGMWNETTYQRDYTDLIVEYLNMPAQPTLFVCIPPPIYTNRNAFGIQTHIVNQILPVVVPKVANASAAASEKFKGKVHVIDNFRLFGGGLVHANFTPAYQVNPNDTMGRWPNDCVHLSDNGYAAMAEHVYQHLVGHINALG